MDGELRVRRALSSRGRKVDVGWGFGEVERTLLGVSGKGGGSVSDLRGEREGRGTISLKLSEGWEEGRKKGVKAHHLFERKVRARRERRENDTVSISSCISCSPTERRCVRARGGPEGSI